MNCEFCKKEFKTKYTLKTHLVTNKLCLNLRGLSIDSKYKCNGCESLFTNNIHLNKHIEICKEYLIKEKEKEHEEKIKEQEQIYEEKLKEKEKKHEEKLKEQQQIYEEKLKEQQQIYEEKLKEQQQIYEEKLKEQHQINEKQLKEQQQTEKILEKFEKLVERSIDKPTTITNNNNTKNIFSTTQYIEDINEAELKKKLYLTMTKADVMEGQKGIAKICTEEIIKKTKDKKPLLICTDVNRRNYKHVDKNGNIKTDHQARNFIEKVSKPIKEVSKELCDDMISTIEDEKEQLDENDFDARDQIRTREYNVINKFVDITNFDDSRYNSIFMSELAILNKTD